MGLSLQGLIRGISPIAQVGSAVVSGYKQDRDDAVKRALTEAAEKRAADKAAIDAAIAARTLRTPVLGDPAYAPAMGAVRGAEAAATVQPEVDRAKALMPLKVDEAAQTAAATAPVAQATHQANRQFDVEHPLPQPSPTLSFQTIGGTATEPGKVVALNPKTGEQVREIGDAKAPTAGSGSAKMMQAVASNDAMVKNIDDAIAAVRAHQNSFGLEHGRGIPLVGGFLDQRIDPQGTGPRAQVANIGSQKLHDRSGAAVTASEFPRLQPFIPSSQDDATSIITKLEQMKKVVQNENDAMRQAGAPHGVTPSDTKQPTAIPSFEEWLKKNGGRPPDA